MASTFGIALAGIGLCALAACGTDPTPNAKLAVRSDGAVQTGATAYVAGTTNNAPDSNNLINLFKHNYDRSIGMPMQPGSAQEFYLSGVELIRANCQEFFTRIGELRQSMDFGQNTLATAGTATVGILGITGASANTLALIGAGIAATLGLSENYSNAYLFNPDTQAVQQLVVKAQNAYLEEKATKPPENFYQALSYLQGLQNLCEVHSIKKLVNETLLQGRIVTDKAFAGLETAADLTWRQEIGQKVGKVALTDSELAGLYWYLIDGSYDANTLKVIDKTIGALPKGPLKNGAPNPPFEENALIVKTLLGQLSTGLRERLNAIIASWKNQPASEAPASGTNVMAAPN